MRSHYWTVIVPLIAGGLFIACDKDSEPDDLPKGSLTEDSAPGLSGQEALKPNATGWEDGGVDAVSSASILRVSRSTFGYIDKADGGGGGCVKNSVKIVEVNTPTTARE
ncbi:MAG: hypothetical protein LBG72_06190, partial [Spirochaetaceae bacterium]|nr:hypothetical protein [Spirochaetaceae bacterium]